jgi:hypothetical protein
MIGKVRWLMVGMVTLSLAGPVLGQTSDGLKIARPPKNYRWEKEAKTQGLGEKDIELLRRNKFVLTGQPFKQVFQPYLGSKVPVFITTDSLLNGFHVLFEESIYRLEQAHARKLPALLETLWKNLDRPAKPFKGDPRLLKAAWRRAVVFLGTALHLLDARALPQDADLRALVREEVRRIVAAKGKRKPAWLGKPDRGFQAIDYSRFQPRGFYTKTPVLQRYFQAVSWLQAIPFRLDRDEELAAFFFLYRAYQPAGRKRPAVEKGLWGDFSQFLGTQDDWDLPAANTLPKEITKKGLAKVRKEYMDRASPEGGPQINDQLRFAPDRPGAKPEIAFRFLSAYRLPDAVLFQRTTWGKLKKRPYPDGLEVCAVLRSSFARDQLAKVNPEVVKEIDRSRPLFQGDSLYAKYLKCLETLLERTEPDAPEFLRSQAWKIKTCQTALASWAQMRHTWALQAKPSIRYMSKISCPAGFVEPVPEFYGRLARLVEETRQVLKKAGALAPTGWKEMAAEIKEAQAILGKARKNKKGLGSLSRDEKMLLARFAPHLNDRMEAPHQEKDSKKILSELSQVLSAYTRLAKRFSWEKVFLLMGFPKDFMANQWTRLAKVCRRLEILAHKQLRQVRFSAEDNEFLTGYGEKLAGIMLYGGNSYVTPRDDAPRIVNVFTNPVTISSKHVLVGIARPRTLWVLYPVRGVDVLCRGAVLPYQEFTHPKRLTDAAWKTLLDSPRRPKLPAWVMPITVAEKTGKPWKEKK